MRRVAVTGIGMVSPLGQTRDTTWKSLLASQSGVDKITAFDTEGFETRIGAEVKGWDPLVCMDRKEVRRTDRFVQFATAAAIEAVKQAGLEIKGADAERIGCIIGSGIGGIATLSAQYDVLKEKGPSRISPFLIPMMIVDMASGHVSIRLGAKGPNFCTVSACSSGADAIGEAAEMIRRGEVLAMVAGGAEAAIVPIGLAGFAAAGALSTNNDNPKGASRPFDAKRDGFIMGEGAGILVLEDMEYAVARGARILVELAGYGATADANHVTQPAPGGEGGARAMRLALSKSGLVPKDIDYINAHGTSTQLNDKFETMAIKSVFGDEAYKVPISSTKSMTGHLLGAAGAVEAGICVLSITEGAIPPTINLETPDPECDLDYTPHIAKRGLVKTALSNSFGFGGHNSCLVFKRYQA